MPNQNPKDLDPKLKEVYERVMGTPLAANQQPPKETVQPASPPQPAVQSSQTATPPAAMGPVIQTSSIPATPVVSMPEHYNANGVVAGSTKKKSMISPPLLFIAAIIFFLVYSLFWLKFFKVPLPFLPQ